MQRLEARALLRAVAAAALPIQGLPTDYDPPVESVGAARLVLCGEASHGTHELYPERAEITRRLIVEKGFNAVAVEADWPDAYRVDRWVRGAGEDPDAEAGAESYLIGFTTYDGNVIAASNWGAPGKRMRVRPALPGSYEAIFHETDISRFLLTLPPRSEAADRLAEPRLERAIGVVYRPDTERTSHYFAARLSKQFDAVIHVDRTRAVRPIEPLREREAGEAPETYPTAL